jgi:hypothetical protein
LYLEDNNARVGRLFARVQWYRWYYFANLGKAVVAPTERQLESMVKSGELSGTAIAIAVEELMTVLGNPKVPADVDMAQLGER